MPLVALAVVAMMISGCAMSNMLTGDGDRQKLAAQIGDIKNVPTEIVYLSSVPATKEAIVKMLESSGEAVVSETDTVVKTDRLRLTEEVGMLNSMWKGTVLSEKTIRLYRKGKNTRVSVTVHVYHRVAHTGFTRKDWPEVSNAERLKFFRALSKKVRPANAKLLQAQR